MESCSLFRQSSCLLGVCFWTWLLVCVVGPVSGLPEVIRIGGIFDTNGEEDLAFTHAVEWINSDNSILPKSKLSAQVNKVKQHDSFHASKAVCNLLREKVSAFVGPKTPAVVALTKAAANTFNIPHLHTSWSMSVTHNPFTMNLYPHPDVLSKAYLDLVQYKKWKSYTILYEDSDSFIRLKDVLNDSFNPHPKVLLVQYDPSKSYKKILKDIGRKNQFNIILDVPVKKLPQIFREAMEVNMMTYYHDYIITSLDLHTVNLSEFKSIQANVSAFRIVDPERLEVRNVLKDLRLQSLRHGMAADMNSLETDTALIYDAVTLLARALNDLDRVQTIHLQSLYCEDPRLWINGVALRNYMKMVSIKGLTGNVRLDDEGLRTDFNLDVIELKSSGVFKNVAVWNHKTGLEYAANYSKEADQEFLQDLKTRTLRVTTVVNPPYTMVHDDKNYTGNDRFYGYTKDLIHELSKQLDFKYEFYLVPDKKYGNKDARGEWNGLLRELLDRKADMAIVDLTITYAREEAVDFTTPFMTTGISILFKKPGEKPPALFSFLHPFSIEVWLYMLTAYLGVSLLLFILARVSPYEWVSPHPCDADSEELENQFNLPNSFWFTIGSLMQQGSDLAPRAISTRIVASLWWFFTLIMISSYTANLAAFLTAQRMSSPIENANDLARQTKIAYGCLAGGSTRAFFEDSDDPLIKRMSAFMGSARPSVYSETNQKGIERVKKGNYAYLMEATTIEYRIERDCELTQVGGLLDNKGYGIATPPGSQLRNLLSRHIVLLQEKATLYKLKERWWKVKGENRCPEEKAASATNELGLSNVGGVFLVLFGGCLIAIALVIGEFVWKAKKVPLGEREPVWTEMLKELKLVVACKGSKQNTPKTPEGSLSESLTLSSLRGINNWPNR